MQIFLILIHRPHFPFAVHGNYWVRPHHRISITFQPSYYSDENIQKGKM